MWMSVPHRPQRLTRTSTSSSAISGTGTCRSSKRPGAASTAARMVVGVMARPSPSPPTPPAPAPRRPRSRAPAPAAARSARVRPARPRAWSWGSWPALPLPLHRLRAAVVIEHQHFGQTRARGPHEGLVRGMGQGGVARRRVLEARQEAVGEALVQTFRAVVGAPFDLLHMWDLGGERLEALRAVRLLGGGGFGLETNEHDMPDHGISLWSGRGAAMHRTRSAAFSLIITDGALVLELTSRGMTELSQMRRPSMPCTRSCGSTTEAASPPMRQVPTGW